MQSQSCIPLNLGDLPWRIAQMCNGGTCVRVASNGDTVFIGDSKSPSGPVLRYTRDEWTTFVAGVKHGDFDDLF
jgi:Domain of unknown function (DUF397)